MSDHRCLRTALGVMAIALLAVVSLSARAPALEGPHSLRGLFCNTEAQIDLMLTLMRQNVGPEAAVDVANLGGIVCTHVTSLDYLVVNPTVAGAGHVGFFTYEAMLVGVVVGGRVRPVEPPARVFFFRLHPLDAITVGSRT